MVHKCPHNIIVRVYRPMPTNDVMVNLINVSHKELLCTYRHSLAEVSSIKVSIESE